MSVSIVVGGQFGSEGKGKVTALLARQHPEPWVVRCGGPNSGHTTCVAGREIVLRQLPAAAGHEHARLLLSAGCVVSENILISEINVCGVPRGRIIVDPRAVLVTADDVEAERVLSESIGSTASGTGAALVRRMSRGRDVRLVEHSTRLRDYVRIENVSRLLHGQIDDGGHVIIEGTQGFGLSLLHGDQYPYVTSRDTSAAAFTTEAGLSPRQVDNIVMVLRTFPIRVAGNSGPLNCETSWDVIGRMSGAPTVVPELTSVTRQVRRVGQFDLQLVKAACIHNRPTSLAVMGLDRLDYANTGASDATTLTDNAVQFLSLLESELLVSVEWVGTGFKTYEAINTRFSRIRPTCAKSI